MLFRSRDIVVFLNGGLGNQMFQYAAGRALSVRLNAPLSLETFWFAYMQGETPRRFDLGAYNIEARCLPGNTFSMFLRQALLPLRSVFTEMSPVFQPAFHSLNAPVFLRGYFQSEKYFIEYADVIRRDFSLKDPLSQKAQGYLRDVGTTPVPIAVHVRRGDYVSDPRTAAFHGACSWEYYDKAMRLMRERLGDVRFFFFSDEPDWLAAQQVRGTIVSGLSPHEDMFLMSRCAHQIIANSSFSWWGAWLNRNPDKIVVAPKRWLLNDYYEQLTGDLVPEGWIRL